MKQILLVFTLTFVLFSSCKTDFDVNAPYKETMVIYGLLNMRDSVQYIRVSKAYLGIGNALVMAQQQDSINYANVLTVTLEGISNGSVVENFGLSRIDTIPKDDGVFASPYQVYYATRHAINPANDYRLTVRNNQTGVIATSTTKILGDITVLHPTPGPPTDSTDFSAQSYTSVDFNPGTNAYIYDLVIRFHYTETDTTGTLTQYFVDWNFNDQVTNDVPVRFGFYRPNFYKVLGSSIPFKAGVIRRIDNLAPGYYPVEYRFIAGSEDLLTYDQLQQPSTGIAQEKPLFTTINNGLGLFTSRLIHSVSRRLNTASIAAFDTSAYTQNLNFHF